MTVRHAIAAPKRIGARRWVDTPLISPQIFSRRELSLSPTTAAFYYFFLATLRLAVFFFAAFFSRAALP
jgi:hypothetical protein